MIEKVNPSQFLNLSANMPVLDVRSPAEFVGGHIPRAFNLPLFDDDERAVIGTLYKKAGREASLLKGLDITGPKMSGFVKTAIRVAPKRAVLLHCWRGGMRSESIAWLLSLAGFQVFLLAGGYKAYRQFIREEIGSPARYIIIGGSTGSGKTEILENLRKSGQQVLDLEKIAHHKGSAFGLIGEKPQPTNEQFENDLFDEWNRLDHGRIIWVEDESHSVGKVFIPHPLYEQIQKSKIIQIQLSKENRIRRLVTDYASFPKEELKHSVVKISRKMGGQHAAAAIQAIDEGDFGKAVGIILFYYDKMYDFGIKRHEASLVFPLITDTTDAAVNAEKVLELSIDTHLI
jgi:tRNA 2-selenouridine synthase